VEGIPEFPSMSTRNCRSVLWAFDDAGGVVAVADGVSVGVELLASGKKCLVLNQKI